MNCLKNSSSTSSFWQPYYILCRFFSLSFLVMLQETMLSCSHQMENCGKGRFETFLLLNRMKSNTGKYRKKKQKSKQQLLKLKDNTGKIKLALRLKEWVPLTLVHCKELRKASQLLHVQFLIFPNWISEWNYSRWTFQINSFSDSDDIFWSNPLYCYFFLWFLMVVSQDCLYWRQFCVYDFYCKMQPCCIYKGILSFKIIF